MLYAGFDGVVRGKYLLHLLRSAVGADVIIVRRLAKKSVPNTAPYDIGFIAPGVEHIKCSLCI